MPMYEEPVVGAFYEDEDGRKFEVISFDENDGTIEIRYGDNSREEFDLDDWFGMDLEKQESDKNESDDKEKSDDSDDSDDDPELDDDADNLDGDREE